MSTGGLRIGQLAAAAGVNPKTIRYYEEVGLLPMPRRSKSGYRLYDEHDRERLGFIRRAKQFGFSLAEIGTILAATDSGEQPCERVLGLIDRKIETTAQELRALTNYYRRVVELRSSARSSRHFAVRRDAERNRCICGIIEAETMVR